jgi:kynureninase
MKTRRFEAALAQARHLDALDALAPFRRRFLFAEPNLIYLDGNSLGRLPGQVRDRMRVAVESEWGQDLIRGWNAGWYEAPARVGEKIARIVGASPNQLIISDSTSVNLFKLALAGLAIQRGRTGIVTDALNFPSDLYVLQGCARILGDRHRLQVVPSSDGITIDQQALLDSIDERTALVCLSHVAFKSGHLYDAAAITEHAHRVGALILWDLSHSAGVVPIELDAWNADLAVGCTYKYLNGGPGAPAFLFVRKGLQEQAPSPIWGWFGHRSPFAFDLDYHPPTGIQRFLVGTPPILSLLAMEAALEPLFEAGIVRVHEKAMQLTSYLVDLADSILSPLGFELASPRDPARRGAHVSLRHENAYRINRALIEEMNVLPDFREPDNIRLGLSPLYTSYEDVWTGIDRIRQVVVDGRYERYSEKRLSVT